MANYDYPPKHTCCDAFSDTYRVMWDSQGSGSRRNPLPGYYLVTDVEGCASCGPTPEPSGAALRFCPWCGTEIAVASS